MIRMRLREMTSCSEHHQDIIVLEDLTDHWAHSRELRAPAPIRELRDLTRYRKVLIQAMSV